jgi:DNA-binding PadR family transcriptional regulator
VTIQIDRPIWTVELDNDLGYECQVGSLNATAGSLLGFLLEGPKAGWDLLREVDSSVGYFWNVTRSQVYRELRMLADAGLTREQAPGKRERVLYTITAAGKTAFREWIGGDPGPDLLRLPIVLRVYFGEHVEPALLRRHLQKARVEHQARLAEYEKLLEKKGLAGKSFPRQTVLLGVAYERAFLDWLEQLPWIDDGPSRARR